MDMEEPNIVRPFCRVEDEIPIEFSREWVEEQNASTIEVGFAIVCFEFPMVE
jgi:hypothetical protein